MVAIVPSELLLIGIAAAYFICSASSYAVSSPLPEPGTCGLSLGNRVLGGNRTDLNGYPWTALLVVQTILGSFAGYACGGSLIASQFVLTAAHCFEDFPSDLRISKVRLGDWDIFSPKDCVDGLCADAPVEIRVAGHIVHPDYTTEDNHNDIALIKLERQVQFTEFISPVCLPLVKDLRTMREASKKFTVVGWGARERGAYGSQYKLAVDVPGVSVETCRKTYPAVIDTEMCAGGDPGKDSCQGDSGGSLVLNDDGYWYQFGVVSYGLGCGIEGVPGVYTRVTSYLDWIQKKTGVSNKIKPDQILNSYFPPSPFPFDFSEN
ncbi:CLIP domain-containing serine protease B4-like [Uranotaenia lowii]|uniref:CLIP domain-containing serine protease B4-like n=1 Tax=Uranotaenia lowii TaxID=190385 RepID=UPI0024799EF1|nr:CLIP domain-containing serine protease B4-like [Uranotaenia lowii]